MLTVNINKVISTYFITCCLLLSAGCLANNENLDQQLYDSVEDNNKREFKKLLKKGANPNAILAKDFLVMSRVMVQNDLDYLKLAIEYGADVNLVNKLDGNRTPLFYAVRSSNTEALQYLLENGANAGHNIANTHELCKQCSLDDGRTALISAAFSNDFKMAFDIFEYKGYLEDYEIKPLIYVIEDSHNILENSETDIYRRKFADYLQEQGHAVNPNIKPECEDRACREAKKYSRLIERCEIVRNNPPEKLSATARKNFLHQCEENMSIYLEKSIQN